MKCLFPGCKATPYARGLCSKHYVAAWRVVKAGHMTWEQLEKEGKALPPEHSGRLRGKCQQWFISPKT